MLRGRLALAVVHLCLACLLVLTSQSITCSRDISVIVEKLLKCDRNSNCSGCRLYTPSIEDYKRCPRSTMLCFANESKVLMEEWDHKCPPSPRLDKKLGQLAQWFKQPESECRPCELQNEETSGKFLADLLATLQMIKSQYCA